ncbi:helix-turn-helix domain-containing protein [Lactobacillus sp. DCY120]|uniref:Helix-turn-helix domain-containing protein n=1 Tax=Bombilactobacillus apium TaxID=2675299 RepID=A0A850R9F7_9LACO|nr:helix-turn-helix domain-containing protein [Bombilactobacillus apium]
MSTSTLSQFQRGAIASLLRQGKSQAAIAQDLGVAKSTISYELQRVQPYDPELAQADADRKRRHCGRKSILTPQRKQLVEHHLRLTWSSDYI